MSLEDLYTADSHDEGSEVQVKNSKGELVDFYIQLAGMDSQVYRDEFRKQNRLKFLSGEEKDYDLEILVAATIGWRGEFVEVEFSKEKARELYIQAPYVRDRCEAFVVNRANFTKS